MQPSDSSPLPRRLRLLDFPSRPVSTEVIAGKVRSPRFQRVPFLRDVAFDPGRATGPRITAPHMLPSTDTNASAPASSFISWLNPTPHKIAVYASPRLSPSTTQHSLPGGLTRAGLSPAGPRQPPGAPYLYPKNAAGEFDFNDPDLAAECAIDMIRLGFTAVKFDPAGPYTAYSGHHLSLGVMDRCATFCAKIREAVDSAADLLIGTHGQMVPASAIRLARRLEKYDPLWFEEPVPPGQEAAMAEVARATSIPIATGERLTTKYEFQRVLELKAASILQMNVARVGGLLEAKKIAAMAEARYAQIAPHLYNGPVGAAASIHPAATSPNFLIHEAIVDFSGFHADILKTKLAFDDGYLIPPTEPGLGVELNLDVVARHWPYEGERLHLEMAAEPADVKEFAPARG